MEACQSYAMNEQEERHQKYGPAYARLGMPIARLLLQSCLRMCNNMEGEHTVTSCMEGVDYTITHALLGAAT